MIENEKISNRSEASDQSILDLSVEAPERPLFSRENEIRLVILSGIANFAIFSPTIFRLLKIQPPFENVSLSIYAIFALTLIYFCKDIKLRAYARASSLWIFKVLGLLAIGSFGPILIYALLKTFIF
jgi:hypothetical protein